MLEIRPLAATDAPAVHRLLGDPEVAFWFRPAESPGPFTLSECEAMVIANVGHWAAHGFGISLAWEDGECDAASRRVMEKLGLGYEQEFDHRGVPHVLYVKGPSGAGASAPQVGRASPTR